MTAKLEAIKGYVPTAGIPDESLLKMTKLGVVIDGWMDEMELVASAIQCWTSMQEYYGVVPCTVMSMMSNGLMPSACETDIAGDAGRLRPHCKTNKMEAVARMLLERGIARHKCATFADACCKFPCPLSVQ